MTGASENRVTLSFESDSGREYLYDDVTGNIFPWTPLREAVLRSDLADAFEQERAGLYRQYGEPDVEATYRFVRHWRDRYGAFVRQWGSNDRIRVPSASELEAHIRGGSFALILILTENCNLRCGYCSLSEVYPLNRVRTDRRMTLETARRAVDWYAELISPQVARNPRKRFGLSLYGGEPMMNTPVLRDVLEYCAEKYPRLFLPVMTTNGTALTPRNIETLVEHDVLVGISIDGPADEHDRLRIDSRGRGTFDTIARNLRYVKEHYPEYWKNKLTSVSVYDWGTDLEIVEGFFRENADIVPRSVFVNQVGSRNTNWYARYTSEDADRMNGGLERLRQSYKRAKINGEDTSHYLNCLIGMGISMVILRQRALDQRAEFLPFTGTCIPGDKLAVHVDGKIDMCERVNGKYPLGHLDQGGIDYAGVSEIIESYQRQVMRFCHRCANTKHCGMCFSVAETEDGFVKEAGRCASIADSAKRRMSDFMTIMEANPSVDLNFETDTSMLEQRMLFQY
jgi:uncharacterized protein